MSEQKSKSVLIACGGSGGHLAPGIALAQELTARGHDCRLLVSGKQVDQRLRQKYPELHFESLPAVAMSRNPAGFAKFAWSQLAAMGACWKLMGKFSPDAVVGFGGFLSVSAGICAYIRRTPLILHEANYRVGRTIRMLSRLAHTVYVPTGIEPFPKLGTRHVLELGMPLRSDLQKTSREEARRTLGLPLRGRLLVILGGSQGATALNQWAIDHETEILEAGIHLYCVTGLGKIPAHTREVQLPLGQQAKSIFVPFSDQMHLLYMAADLAVARAGAGTITELVYFNTPSILIPFPYAADDHQRANANHLERLGGTVVVDESQIDNLMAEVLYSLKSETLLESLRDNLARIDMGSPAATIADEIESLKPRHEKAQKTLPTAKLPLEARFEAGIKRLLGTDNSLKLLLNEPMGPKTTFGIGGPARFYAEPASIKELQALLKVARDCGVEVFFLGRGSNVLVLDKGYDGLVIRLNNPAWQKIEVLSGRRIRAGAGARLKALCGEACRQGLEGFEFLEGIPATVGGACRMNAGAMGGWFFERVEKIQLMDRFGNIVQKDAQAFSAAYRRLEGIGEALVLSVVLKAVKSAPAEVIRQTIEAHQTKRRASQPTEPSAGCVFRNPEGKSAGRLIDQTGLKGLRMGDACVSPTHANFIVNMGAATAADVIALINEVRARIWATDKIVLEPEIMLLGGAWRDYLLPIAV